MYTRLLQPQIVRLATQYPVVTLTGPRQSGKTTLCQMTFPNYDYVNLEDISIRERAIHDPKGFLNRYSNRVIFDEIQRAPNLPSYLQVHVDQRRQNGQFILTGSEQFSLTDTINQSLAGRTALATLLPLSFLELYSNNIQIPLSSVLYSGFYPRIFDHQLNPTEALSFYLATYVERDLRTLIHVKNLTSFTMFLKLCAAQVGQLVNCSRLSNDCGVDQKTIKSWLSALEASYIIFQTKPHHQNFRKRLTKSNKLYFYDVGLACCLLDISNSQQLIGHPLRGLLFENFIVSELLKNRYNHVQNKNLYFFRDHSGHEVDLILDYGRTLYSIEIKASETFSYHFLKGLDYYEKLAKGANVRRIILYAGDSSFETQNTHVFSYKNLSELFKFLSSEDS